MLETGAHTLYAHWTPIQYTVAFNANGGKVSTASKNVAFGTGYGNLPTPTRAKYKFTGWYTAKSGGVKVGAGTKYTVVGNTTLYARWSPLYTVNFNANKGSVKTRSKEVAKDASYGSLPTPKRAGYKFDGWYTAKSGGKKITSATKATITKAQTLYAHWTVKKYTVKYNVSGGKKLSAKSKSVTYGKKYGKLPTPKRAGYKFMGWYTKKSGGTKITAKSKVKITKTQTLYAHWVRR
jgi:uncharacterized repeat protein (TIGR02543 family)